MSDYDRPQRSMLGAGEAPPEAAEPDFKIRVSFMTRDVRSEHRGDDNPLRQVFFLPQNMQIIQNAVRREVSVLCGEVVQEVARAGLLPHMHEVYETLAEFHPEGVTQQVERLNAAVVRRLVPLIHGGLQGHRQYLADRAAPLRFLPNPSSGRDWEKKELVRARLF